MERGTYGSTQRVFGDFRDSSEQQVTVTSPQLVITDEFKNELDTFDLSDVNKLPDGSYFYDLPLTYLQDFVYYGFVGTYSGVQIAGRHKLYIDYAEE